ncbi:glycoside hydrolase family 67 protein [Baudoinia panamericana UAMH 10762]|uniref:Alpha-glucuronidase n=1 Tax=Baudoinia panamericana (strain UAMH 10762) TaxID=717646 RepID=M2N5G8_BAUPA|nr:glycoside hydrolase family 67 protein [Baudoinia panamericana UAMH 10762]EMC99278.1 glycoside hydrolase family 67 protein [Baudoinia panamericana UAMH 10762]
MLRFSFLSLLTGLAAAESGLNAWLRYAPYAGSVFDQSKVPLHIVALNTSTASPVYVAGQELQTGIDSIFGQQCNVHHSHWGPSATIVVGTIDEYTSVYGELSSTPELIEDGFWLNTTGNSVQILGQNERGALYGAFEYLSMLAQANFTPVAYAANPAAPIRWTNEWDNLDGSIERGFAGNSIFFANGVIVSNLTRAAEYARILASIRINAVVVNNVNANASLLTPDNIAGLGRIADAMRPYGVQVGISLFFASPTSAVQGQANLTTFDPLDPGVVNWWTNVTNQIYAKVPDMAGYLVKANSEGQPGPLTYNRTLAEGANLFAKALQPYGGVVMFRAFVYNLVNESIWTQDRAVEAVQFFQPLDGQFDENVVIQIKYGPIDFQVREPASPLFANIPNTNTAIELQVTQEYLGQQCHLVYLPPLWQTVLDFDLRVDNKTSLVRDVITGQRFNRTLGGSAGVVNVGLNETWLGSHLSLSNLYAYGRLAWNPADDPTSMVQDWIRLTFGLDQSVIDAITQMSLESWPAYENYSGNLGEQTLTDILYTHYGPNPQSQENNGYGQWTRSDHLTVGMDRTVSNGTGFSGQYPPEVFQMFENISTTPDNLLLWFHHVNYTQMLKSGVTVIQDFYDQHYAGAATAQTFVSTWQSIQGLIDAERYSDQLFRLVYQAGHSLVWRDAIVNFYNNISGIPDEAGRVGNHPYRIEAESMTLSGYRLYYYAPNNATTPFETLSNYTAIVTTNNKTTGTAYTALNYPTGRYDISVNYYDQYGGASNFSVYLNNNMIGQWTANLRPWIGSAEGPRVLGHTPSIYIDGESATRITFSNVSVAHGDVLTITGIPDANELAPLDYVSVLPLGYAD